MLKILGLRPYNYDKEGKHYEGVTIHSIDSDFETLDNSVGQGVFSKSVSSDCFETLRNGRKSDELIGIVVEPKYNKYGRICELVEV